MTCPVCDSEFNKLGIVWLGPTCSTLCREVYEDHLRRGRISRARVRDTGETVTVTLTVEPPDKK